MPFEARSTHASRPNRLRWFGPALPPCSERAAEAPCQLLNRAVRSAAVGQLACLAVVAGVVSLGCREHAPTLHRIASSSMEPKLHGPGLVAECVHCGNTARIFADIYQSELPVRCYRCGGSCRVSSEVLPGDAVSIEPLDANAMIRRFDLVAFNGSEPEPGFPLVKRVWGLPGESLEIRDGEVWRNGTPLQKSLDELLRIGIVLARFPDRQMGQWSIQHEDGLVDILDPSQARLLISEKASLCWNHLRPASVALQETAPDAWRVAAFLNDDYVGNQGLSYQLQPVTDYFLQVRFRSELESPCVLTCRFQDRWLRINLTPHGDAYEQEDGSGMSVVGKRSWTVGLCEGRILVRSDLSESIQVCSDTLADFSHSANSGELFRLASMAGEVEVEELVIGRDLYVRTTNREGAGSQRFVVPADAFFVLGDNLPASVDSRSTLGAIPRSRVLGVVEKYQASLP